MRSRGRWILRAVLLVTVGLVALVVLTTRFLFAGSEVVCSELADADGPSLRCEFTVGAPTPEVWEAFTLTGEPRPFYFDAILEAEIRAGGRWRFVTDNRERLLAGGTVLALEHERRFEQSFEAADLEDPPSRITVDLQPVPDGCSVTLVHDRFPHETETYRRFRRAHPLALSAMKALLETGDLPVRARLYTAIFKPGMKLVTVRAEPWE